MLWINDEEADKSVIEDGDLVEVSNHCYSEQIRANVTGHMPPEAVFLVHGFGQRKAMTHKVDIFIPRSDRQ